MSDFDLDQIEEELEIDGDFTPATEVSESNHSLKDLVVAKEDEADEESIEEKVFNSILEEDFETARANIRSLIENGEDVLKSMIMLAKASDHPRAFEVVSTLMNTILSANKELIALHEKKTKVTGQKEPAQQANTINNTQNILEISTADLQKMLTSDEDESEF